MKLKPFACIIINIFYILINFMIICIIIRMHCKRLLQMQDLHSVFTTRPRSVVTGFPQRTVLHAMQTLSRGVLSMLVWPYRRLQSEHTALLATAQRAPRRSAFFRTLWERCKGATLV